MAAPKKRPASGRSARSTSSRKAASTRTGSSRRQKTQDADEDADEGGIGWEGGIGIVTFLILLAGILILDHDLGTKYPEEGIFFDVPADTASTGSASSEE